jgi:hypothetical protein
MGFFSFRKKKVRLVHSTILDSIKKKNWQAVIAMVEIFLWLLEIDEILKTNPRTIISCTNDYGTEQ